MNIDTASNNLNGDNCLDTVSNERDGFATPYHASSRFTAINEHPETLPTPIATVCAQSQQESSRPKAIARTKRRRDATVAQYLGLGKLRETLPLESRAPASNGSKRPHIVSARTRPIVASGDTSSETPAQQNILKQEHITRRFRVKKSRTANDQVPKAWTPGTSQLHNTSNLNPSTSPPSIYNLSNPSVDETKHYPEQFHETWPGNYAPQEIDQDVITTAPARTDCIDCEYFDDDFVGWSSDIASLLEEIQHQSNTHSYADEYPDGSLEDEDFLIPASSVMGAESTANLPSITPSDPDANQSEIEIAHEETSLPASPVVEPGTDSCCRRDIRKFVSPVTLNTRILAVTGDADSSNARKPIVRPKFPTVVRDRSPIIGLSSKSSLRTCFRIGELINQAHQATQAQKHVFFELYARVLGSERRDRKQFFTFCDLFHVRPPHINAVYDGAIWESVRLFNYDSARLLKQGRLCRCVGTMKRDGNAWIMNVLNIWEATWEDIGWVEGVLSS